MNFGSRVDVSPTDVTPTESSWSPRNKVKLGALPAPNLTTISLLVGLNAWTASRMPGRRPLQY